MVDKASRNKCQYCRLKKCLILGMSKEGQWEDLLFLKLLLRIVSKFIFILMVLSAVKFGRMPKKQKHVAENGGGRFSEDDASKPCIINEQLKTTHRQGIVRFVT